MSDDTSTKRAAQGAAPLVAQELGEQIAELAQTANSALNGVSDAVGLTSKVEKSPYAMLAAALGAGYVVGGGLFSPTTARLFRLGIKLASVPVVQDKLLEYAEAALDGVLQQAKKTK